MKGRHIRATEMDDSSKEGEEVAESSQSNEEKVINTDRKSTRLNSSHVSQSRMPSSA